MGAVYAICGEYEIPNRKGKGFSPKFLQLK